MLHMKPKDAALLLLAMLIFSGNFVASKYALMHFPPFFSTALRFIMISVLLVPFVKFPRRQFKPLFLYSMVCTLHFSMGVGGMYYGLKVATNIIVSQLGVPISCALGAMFLGEKFGPWRAFGMAIAFAGIMMVVGSPSVESNFGAFAMSLVGAFMGAVASIQMKRMEVPFFAMMGWMTVFATPQLLVLSAVFEHDQLMLLRTVTAPVVVSLLYTVLVANIGAFAIWTVMLRKYPVNIAAPFGLLVPIFGIILAQLFFGEHLSWQVLAGGIVTTVGVAIIILRRPKRETISEVT